MSKDVGLEIDAAVWHPTVFTHNRDRLLETEVARAFTLQRLMAGAEAGEVVRLIGEDHHDLFPWCLRIESSNPRAKRDRRGAIAEALKRYDTVAAEWGLTDLLSRQDYEALLRGCFRLFDAEYGWHLLRPIAATA